MSNHNPYNVLVEMEDTAYRQPTTVESDGLEFQDFLGPDTHPITGATPPPPPSSSGRTPQFYEPQQQNSTRSSQPIWSLDYYSAFFDVDTSQVLERCLKTLYPVGDFASETLQHQPDMYGPSWIATTVVFLVFVCSSLAGSLAAYIAEAKHVYDFRLLSYAVFVIYTYTFLSPLLIWGAAKYYGCQPSLFEIVNYYGYSLTVWIPVSLLCVLPFDYARWGFVAAGFLLTTYFLVKNLYSIISRADSKTSRILLLAVVGAHVIFTLTLKVAFYSYDFPVMNEPDLPKDK